MLHPLKEEILNQSRDGKLIAYQHLKRVIFLLKHNHMKRYIKILAFLFMIGLVACEYDYIPEEEIVIPTPDPDDPISFKDQIEPIFQSKCISCHDSKNPILTTGVAYSSLTDGDYIKISDPTDSKIYKRSKDGHGANMSSAELTLLLLWIQEGAKDN
jgi:hypothetical protein